MGQLTLPSTGLVYVDTSVVIYAIEQIEPYSSAASALWSALDAGEQQVVTSELTLLEVLVKPIRDDNPTLTDLYREILLNTAGFHSLPIGRDILESAAELRAHHRLRTPDAIHAASALAAECEMFLTNDTSFRKIGGLNVQVLSEIANS